MDNMKSHPNFFFLVWETVLRWYKLHKKDYCIFSFMPTLILGVSLIYTYLLFELYHISILLPLNKHLFGVITLILSDLSVLLELQYLFYKEWRYTICVLEGPWSWRNGSAFTCNWNMRRFSKVHEQTFTECRTHNSMFSHCWWQTDSDTDRPLWLIAHLWVYGVRKVRQFP